MQHPPRETCRANGVGVVWWCVSEEQNGRKTWGKRDASCTAACSSQKAGKAALVAFEAATLALKKGLGTC